MPRPTSPDEVRRAGIILAPSVPVIECVKSNGVKA